MNLLLTCGTLPDFSPQALDLWNKFCIAEWMPGSEIVPYLRFSPSSAHASIDAIVFLRASPADLVQTPDGRIRPFPDVFPVEGDYWNAIISERIRNLPDSCAMRDGRKWKSIPQVVLRDQGYRHPAYYGLDVEFALDVTEHMLFSGYASPITWRQIEKIISKYHQRVAAEYERIGFLVVVDHGLYRVRRAYRKKNLRESEFYFGGEDKRRFRGFVTFGREQEGVDYEMLLLEQLLNDPKAGERELHHFFEEHPDLLAESMMGVPISHQPHFDTNKQTPDFSITPVLPRNRDEWVKLLELKGPEAKVLTSERHLHRSFTPAVTYALAQVRDYDNSINDPLNLAKVEKALGYIPRFRQLAVLIGRTPPARDQDLWERRKAELPEVRIITYDEILQEQRVRQEWRRG